MAKTGSTHSNSDPAEHSAAGLEALLRNEDPAERERIIRAWHQLLAGDPDALPVQFALVTRGVGRFLASTVEEARSLLTEAHAARREGELARSEFSLEADRKLSELTDALEAARRVPGHVEEAVKQAREAVALLSSAASEGRRVTRLGWFLFLGCFAAGVVEAGYWIGGDWRASDERNQIAKLIHRWESGDKAAYGQLLDYVDHYREPQRPHEENSTNR